MTDATFGNTRSGVVVAAEQIRRFGECGGRGQPGGDAVMISAVELFKVGVQAVNVPVAGFYQFTTVIDQAA